MSHHLYFTYMKSYVFTWHPFSNLNAQSLTFSLFNGNMEFSLIFRQGPKQYPYNNLYLERGGDPDKEPEEVKNYEI